MTCKVGEGQGERAAVRTGGSWEKAGPTGSWGARGRAAAPFVQIAGCPFQEELPVGNSKTSLSLVANPATKFTSQYNMIVNLWHMNYI